MYSAVSAVVESKQDAGNHIIPAKSTDIKNIVKTST